MGQGQTGPLRRRFRRAGAGSEGGTGSIHRVETGTVDGIGHQPEEDADCGSEADGGQSGFSGIYVPIRPRPAWPAASLFECHSLEEVLDEAAGSAAGTDQQPVLFQTDSCPDSGTESKSGGLGRLLQLWLSESGLPQSQLLCAAAS